MEHSAPARLSARHFTYTAPVSLSCASEEEALGDFKVTALHFTVMMTLVTSVLSVVQGDKQNSREWRSREEVANSRKLSSRGQRRVWS